MSKSSWSHRAWRIWVVGLALALGAAVMPALVSSASATTQPGDGDPVWIGTATQGYSGSTMHAVYSPVPADTSNPGTPSYWAYCIEHNISARTGATGTVGDWSSFLGDNYFETDPTVAGKVLWIVMHSYPSMSLAAFGAQVGVPGIVANDAVQAVQYAIWQFTEYPAGTPAVNWGFDSPDGQTAFNYLYNQVVGGATMSLGSIPSVTASVTAPAGAQQAGTLVGPFTVHTNQPTVAVTVAPGVAVTDVAGTLINTSAVVDGQQIYLDLRSSTAAGSATVTVTAQGAGGSGMVISVPSVGSTTPTAGSHRQSMILVAGSTATTTGTAAATWTAAPAPTIGTTLVGKMGGTHTVQWYLPDLNDTVAYQNLIPGTSYTLTGELMDKADGSATGITGTVTFTPTQSNGSVAVPFTVPSSFQGKDLVAFEKLTVTGNSTVVASHEDIDDAAQTVSITKPSLGTTLVDKTDGDHTVLAGGGVVVDTIAYQNLAPGIPHTVTGELYRKSDGTATGITASKTFTPGTTDGTVDVEFTVPAGYAGESLVAFERVSYQGSATVIAKHEDINDTAQTVAVTPAPSIGTTLTDKADGDHTIPSGGGTVTDAVAYQNLVPGTSYTVTGELRRKSDGSATGITGTKTFTPASASGTVDIDFTVPAGHAGQSLVAFEELSVTGDSTVVASHKDIDDAAQTVSVSSAPSVGTTLVDKGDGDHVIPAGGGTLVDTVAYQNLVPGTQYTVTGELRRKSDGSATGITGTNTFTPATANGTVDVEFTVPSGYAGQKLVAFEELTVTGQPAVVASHKDIDDAAQTVSVDKAQPTVDTQASAVTAETGAALHDVVTITGFVAGGTPASTGTAVLYGPLSTVNDTVCTQANVMGTVTFMPANGTISTPSITVNQPGLYTWQVSLGANDRNQGATNECGLAAETTTVTQPGVGGGERSKVSLTTETSNDSVKPGAEVSDRVTITGFVPGHGATGSATLYGPFSTRDKITCIPAKAVGTVAFTPANGVVTTPAVQVNQTGYYSWVASTTADSHNTAATHACGLVSETTIVHKPSYPTPVVSTGFSPDGWDGAGRRTVDRVSIPSIGVNARTSLVGIKRGKMSVPGNVARTGQLTQSAAAGDLIGTTVIAGHVSDEHDRPGAFWKLTKIRKGKVVTLWQGGKKIKYRVTAIERFSRTKKLPARFFSTTGEHELVLISCANKVRTSGGGFHYSQNVVVTAVPIG